MSDISTDISGLVTKGIEANQNAEKALAQTPKPDIELANSWAAISANWLSLADPRNPEVRKMMRPRRST